MYWSKIDIFEGDCSAYDDLVLLRNSLQIIYYKYLDVMIPDIPDDVTASILNCNVEGAVITCAYSEKNNLVIYDGSPTDDEESRDLDIFRINENCYEVDFKSKASF